MLRIFGKNFRPENHIILQASYGGVYSFSPLKIDASSASVQIPDSFAPGTYSIWMGGYPWSPTSSPAGQITVSKTTKRPVIRVSCTGMVGDGQTDNTQALQSCLDSNVPAAGSLAYLTIPSGAFVLTGEIRPHSYQVLVGTSPSETKLVGAGTSVSAWFTIPQYFGMASLSFHAPVGPYLLAASDSALKFGNPASAGHLFLNNVDVESDFPASQTMMVYKMLAIAGPDIQVYNSKFRSRFDVQFADGAVFSGNSFVMDWGDIFLNNSQNVIFENNRSYAESPLGLGAGDGTGQGQGSIVGASGGGGILISRWFNRYGQSALSQNVYVGYNSFEHMGSPDQQVITTDGGAGAYYGPIESSSASTVVLANDPAWDSTGISNPQAIRMKIISGTGIGQWSTIKSVNGRTMELMTPWKVLPDSSSVVIISVNHLNLTVAHNTFKDTYGKTIGLGDVLESVIEDNVMTNSGQGIQVWGFGPYGGPAAIGQVFNNEVLRNTIEVGTGDLITYSVNTNKAGIGIFDGYGSVVSGLLIRDNVVPGINTIYSTNGYIGVSANLIEQNRANWFSAGANTPGFLLQDNIAQPLP